MKTNGNEIKKEYNELTEEELILKNIDITKKELYSVYNNLDIVTDPDLIDSCIYELKAVQLKYQYFLNKAKEMNIIVKM